MNKVVAFGTFDIFHLGHSSFLTQAKQLGDYLLVVVARDVNVERIKSKPPLNGESTRARKVRQTNLADKVILGSKKFNYFSTLRNNKIDLIALGYDQKPGVKEIKKYLKRHQLGNVKITRLKAFRPKKFKSSLLITHE